MANSKKLAIYRLAGVVITVATVVFIFSNSLQNGQVSGMRSGTITQAINNLLQSWGVPLHVPEGFLRKMGHVGEYMLLGIVAMAAARGFSAGAGRWFGMALATGLLAAVADETLQRFVPGRNGQPADVLLDFASIALGAALCYWLARWRFAKIGWLPQKPKKGEKP